MKYHIYFFETYIEEQRFIQKNLPKEIKAGFTFKPIQEMKFSQPPSEIISIRTQSIIPQNWKINLKGILSRTTGHDHLTYWQDIIPCGYLPLYCSRSVAEQALLLTIALLRKLPQQINQFTNFNRNNISGYEIKNKNVVIFGIGNIGYELFKIFKGLEANTFGVDLEKKFTNVEYISHKKAPKIADIIICAMNLNNTNHNLFNKEFFSRCKDKIIFVNISRGEISPIEDLIYSLKQNKIGALALDVFNNEAKLSTAIRRQDLNSQEYKEVLKLQSFPNVILTPHNAFNTHESTHNKALQSIEQLIYFNKYKKFKWQLFKKSV